MKIKKSSNIICLIKCEMLLKLKKEERFVFAGLTGISLVAVCKK